jgi:transcriptional regulator
MASVYRPGANVVDEETGWKILAASHAGHLVTSAGGSLDATFLPFLVDEDDRRVLAHVARANPMWRDVDGAPGLLIVTGADAYVSPSYYATKGDTGKVVPTWNYTVVHAHGTLRVHDDVEWLRVQVDRLTHRHEHLRDEPWAITDAPAEYIDRNLRVIVGVELVVDRLEAKQKLSQNRPANDIIGVVDGLRQGSAQQRAVADDMEAVQERTAPTHPVT